MDSRGSSAGRQFQDPDRTQRGFTRKLCREPEPMEGMGKQHPGSLAELRDGEKAIFLPLVKWQPWRTGLGRKETNWADRAAEPAAAEAPATFPEVRGRGMGTVASTTAVDRPHSTQDGQQASSGGDRGLLCWGNLVVGGSSFGRK